MSWLYRLNEWLKKYWRDAVVFLLAAVFFLGASVFNYLTQSPDFVKWSSPDETANYVMAKTLAATNNLTIESKYNLIAEGIIAPRSLRADGALLKPVSFLGMMVWYGAAAKIFGPAVLPYLTPLLAAIGLIFFYLLIKKLFGQDNALLSTILLTFFPVYIYYSARSMFHNVPFVVLLIIGCYLILLSADSAKHKYLPWFYALIAGWFCGLAISFRASELIWLGPLLALWWLFNLKRWRIMRPLLFAYGLVAASAPVLFQNYILYGSILASGYPNLNASVANIVSGSGGLVQTAVLMKFGQAREFLAQVYHNFFYFGFKPQQSWLIFNHYLVQMFPWLAYLGAAGFIIFCFRFWRRGKAALLYLLSLLLTGAILILYYGSWKFSDNPDATSFTIGNSYTRYWLPIYLLVLPLVSLAIIRLSRLFRFPAVVRTLQFSAVAVIAGLGLVFVLYGSDEGLVPTHYRQLAAKQELAKVLSATEDNSIIVTRYGDKLFFPERQVIVGLLTDDNMNAIYARLARRVPVYYYNFELKPADLAYLNQSKLALLGVELKFRQAVTPDFSLYEFLVKK